MIARENSSRLYPALEPSLFRRRSDALARFAEWEARQTSSWEPERAIAGVATLYELLPAPSRVRPPDPSGIAHLHRALSILKPRS